MDNKKNDAPSNGRPRSNSHDSTNTIATDAAVIHPQNSFVAGSSTGSSTPATEDFITPDHLRTPVNPLVATQPNTPRIDRYGNNEEGQGYSEENVTPRMINFFEEEASQGNINANAISEDNQSNLPPCQLRESNNDQTRIGGSSTNPSLINFFEAAQISPEQSDRRTVADILTEALDVVNDVDGNESDEDENQSYRGGQGRTKQ